MLAQLTLQKKDETPLHYAIGSNAENIAEMLIKRGADVHLRTSEGRQALHLAAEAGLLDLCKLLLDKGADPTVAAPDGTPAELAEKMGETEVAHYLGLRERNASLKQANAATPQAAGTKKTLKAKAAARTAQKKPPSARNAAT